MLEAFFFLFFSFLFLFFFFFGGGGVGRWGGVVDHGGQMEKIL